MKKVSNKYYFIIAGSREYCDYGEFSSIVTSLFKNFDYNNLVIISGGARGADKMAERFCKENHIKNIVMNAEWDKYRKPFNKFNPAGFIRNRQMHKYMIDHADFDHRGCICFWDNDGRGTSNNFALCQEFNTKLVIYDWIDHRYLNPSTVKGYKYDI